MKVISIFTITFFMISCGTMSEYNQRNYERENSVSIGQVLVHPSNIYSATVIEDGFYYVFNKVGENSLQISPKDMLGYLVGSYYVIPIPRNNNTVDNSVPIETDFKTFITNGFDKRTNKVTEYLTLRDTTVLNMQGVYFEIFIPGNVEITTTTSGTKNYNVYMNHFCYSGVFLKGTKSFIWITKADPIIITKYVNDNMKFDPKTREMFLKFIKGVSLLQPI